MSPEGKDQVSKSSASVQSPSTETTSSQPIKIEIDPKKNDDDNNGGEDGRIFFSFLSGLFIGICLTTIIIKCCCRNKSGKKRSKNKDDEDPYGLPI